MFGQIREALAQLGDQMLEIAQGFAGSDSLDDHGVFLRLLLSALPAMPGRAPWH
ncbi:MAG: hypothetical protein WC213_00435 [Arenimonas sp.]